MRTLFKIILIIFLLGFIFHISASLVEWCYGVFKFDTHGWTHIASIIVSLVIAFVCFKAITKKKKPEEKE